MTMDIQKLQALLAAITGYADAVKFQLDNRTAPNSLKLAGKTLEEIKTEIGAASSEELAEVQALLDAYIARRDNPNQVTKAQVGLGDVENFGVATNAEAIAGTAANKYLTPAASKAALDAFWAAQVEGAPETLNSIAKLAEALENNPDVVEALRTLVATNTTAIEGLESRLDERDGVVDAALADKLGKTEQAADSAKLEGKTLAEVQADALTAATAVAEEKATEAAADKLGKTEQAADSAALGGKSLATIEAERQAAIEAAVGGVDLTALLEKTGDASATTVTIGTGEDARTLTLAAFIAELDSGKVNVEDAAEAIEVTVGTGEDATTSTLAAYITALEGRLAAINSAAADKLGKDEQAADSEKLGGKTLATVEADRAAAIAAAVDPVAARVGALETSQAAQDLAIEANATAIDDIVAALTQSFNEAADDLAAEPQPQ